MWPFRPRPAVPAAALFDRWFQVRVPEGHPSLEAFEAGLTDEERARLPQTLEKLALSGAERIHQVRGADLAPDREGLEYLDELLDAEMRVKLTRDQDPTDPRNLFRVVATEFGCMVGEIWVRAGRGTWALARAPNHWRSGIRRADGTVYDPFRAVVRQMSDEREPGALLAAFDAAPVVGTA